MALTQSLLQAGLLKTTTGDSISSINVSVADPGTNCVLVLLLGWVDDGNATQNVTSISGGSLSWSLTTAASAGGTTSHAAVATAAIGGSGPGAFTLTVAANANFWHEPMGYYAIVKYTGHDTGTPFTGAVVQNGQNGDGAETATLAATPAAGDYAVGISFADADSAGGATEGSGWTELDDHASDGQAFGAGNVIYRTGSTSTTVSWADVNTSTGNYGSAQAAVIVKVSSGGSAAGFFALF